MAEFTGNTLYEMNQQLMANEKKLSPAALLSKRRMVKHFFLTNLSQYFMLLCHDARDYTLFNDIGYNPFNAVSVEKTAKQFTKELFECLKNRGDILAIDKAKENPKALEIWIRTPEGQNLCYYIFDYTLGVIEVDSNGQINM